MCVSADFQDLSLELAIDETETMRGGSFDFTVNDIRFRKAALEDPEWVILVSAHGFPSLCTCA